MKKTDLRVGEHYAAGSTSKYDRWSLNRVELVQIEPLVVRLVERHNAYMPNAFGLRVTDQVGLASARYLIQPWDEYATAKAERDGRVAKAVERRAGRRALADRCVERLRDRGVDEVRVTSDNRVSIAPESLVLLLDGIEA